MNERRQALLAFEKMVHYASAIYSFNNREVGTLLRKLTAQERDSLKHLKSSDLQKYRGWWT